jgi:exopolysaccharide biosynthesis operon protein EpsL
MRHSIRPRNRHARFERPRLKAMSIAAAVVSLACASSALAQTIPGTEEIVWPESGAFIAYPPSGLSPRVWQISAFGALHRDSNIFRLPDGANTQAILGSDQRSDTVRRLGLGFRADVPVSRQVFSVEAAVEDNDFDRYDQLDHTAHNLGGLWRWQVGNQLAGDLGANTRKVLGSLRSNLTAGQSDFVTEDRAYVSGGYLLTPSWRVRGAFDVYNREHSNAARAAAELRTNTTIAGVDYVTAAANSIGGELRYTNGDAPNPQTIGATTVNNDFKQSEANLVAHWAISGKTTLDGRLGYTNRSYEQLSSRDFKGPTRGINAGWAPSPKTLLGIGLWRDVRTFSSGLGGSFSPGVQATPNLPVPAAGGGTTTTTTGSGGLVSSRGGFVAPREVPLGSTTSIIDPSVATTDTTVESIATYAVARGISLGPTWAPTEKIVLQARLLHERLDFRGEVDQALGLAQRREDKFNGLTLSAGWTPIRAVLLALSFQTGKRSSNTVGNFDYNSVTLSGRFNF